MRKKMLNLLIGAAILFLLAGTSLADGAENEAVKVQERKVQYAISSTDLFMNTLDDVMKEELVRSVISEADEERIAKMLYGEDRRNPTYMRAAVVWCVYNRMDASNRPISEDIVHDIFHGYRDGNPVEPWAVSIVRDVTIRYVLEKNGFKNVGRVLPKEYMWFEELEGETVNTFKTTIRISDPECKRWDWSLPSPYAD